MVIDMWARIEGNRVAEITNIDPDGRFHPSLVWVPCGAEVMPGWAYDGGEFSPPSEADQEIPAPSQVTRAQGKAALIQAGLWQDVLDYVSSIDDPTQKALAEVALNDTTHWQRSSPFLAQAAAAIGLSEQDIDDLFIQAASIEL